MFLIKTKNQAHGEGRIPLRQKHKSKSDPCLIYDKFPSIPTEFYRFQ